MATEPSKRIRLNKVQKDEIKEAVEQAWAEANVVNVEDSKDHVLIIRIGNDDHPANIEQLRVARNYADKLVDEGYIPQQLKRIVVAHNIEFTRTALKDMELYVEGDEA